MATATEIQSLLETHLEAQSVNVKDISGGCGASYEVSVVSPKFAGVRLLERHKMVNAALSSVMNDIHALSIKQVWTPDQAAAAQSS